jgi:hypothetical protein
MKNNITKPPLQAADASEEQALTEPPPMQCAQNSKEKVACKLRSGDKEGRSHKKEEANPYQLVELGSKAKH